MEKGNDIAGNPLDLEVKVADLIWVETHGGSWWPAQVVDETNVSGKIKPLKRSPAEVPVRLYGSYKFLYVDPQKCSSDFDMILEQRNGSYREILLKSLEQDSTRMKSCRPKKKGIKYKGEEGAEVLTEAGARRLRVMQNLGLIPPSGSPYRHF